MKTEIKAYIDNLFEGAPLCRESVDLKEEIMQNCMMRFEDALSLGKSEREAYDAAISSIGDVRPLIEEIRQKEGVSATGYAFEAVLDKNEGKKKAKKASKDNEEDEDKNLPFGQKIGRKIIWGSVVPIYLIVSFLSGMWGFTWLLFICAIFAENILDVTFEIIEKRREDNEKKHN